MRSMKITVKCGKLKIKLCTISVWCEWKFRLQRPVICIFIVVDNESEKTTPRSSKMLSVEYLPSLKTGCKYFSQKQFIFYHVVSSMNVILPLTSCAAADNYSWNMAKYRFCHEMFFILRLRSTTAIRSRPSSWEVYPKSVFRNWTFLRKSAYLLL